MFAAFWTWTPLRGRTRPKDWEWFQKRAPVSRVEMWCSITHTHTCGLVDVLLCGSALWGHVCARSAADEWSWQQHLDCVWHWQPWGFPHSRRLSVLLSSTPTSFTLPVYPFYPTSVQPLLLSRLSDKKLERGKLSCFVFLSLLSVFFFFSGS